MKLVNHSGHNHPAKYGGLGIRCRKVVFSLVNRVSLIFNSKAESIRGKIILIWGVFLSGIPLITKEAEQANVEGEFVEGVKPLLIS